MLTVALLPVALLSVALLPVVLLSIAPLSVALLPVALLPVLLLSVAPLSVATLSVVLLPVALFLVALLPAALLLVASFPVALLPVALLLVVSFPVALLSVALLSITLLPFASTFFLATPFTSIDLNPFQQEIKQQTAASKSQTQVRKWLSKKGVSVSRNTLQRRIVAWEISCCTSTLASNPELVSAIEAAFHTTQHNDHTIVQNITSQGIPTTHNQVFFVK